MACVSPDADGRVLANGIVCPVKDVALQRVRALGLSDSHEKNRLYVAFLAEIMREREPWRQ